MAYEDDPYNQPYPNDTSTQTTGTDPMTDPGLRGEVARLYQQLLGRPPENDDVVSQWIQGTGGNLVSIQQGIAASDEAKAYAARPAPIPTQTGSTEQTPAASSSPTPSTGPAPGPNSPNVTPTPNVGPDYTPPPAFHGPPAFSFRNFSAPTGEDVLADPGYGFELNQGIQAIGAKNAALGTLNTGGTIKDFMGFGQNLASTKYNDLFNRKLNEYQTDRGNALDTYNTNYQTQYRDPYQINYMSQYADPFANRMASAGLNQSSNQFNAQLGQQNSQFNANLDWSKFLQMYKANVTDPFDMKYRILGLL